MSCQVPLLLTIHVAKLHTCQYYSHQGYVVNFSTLVYVQCSFNLHPDTGTGSFLGHGTTWAWYHGVLIADVRTTSGCPRTEQWWGVLSELMLVFQNTMNHLSLIAVMVIWGVQVPAGGPSHNGPLCGWRLRRVINTTCSNINNHTAHFINHPLT